MNKKQVLQDLYYILKGNKVEDKTKQWYAEQKKKNTFVQYFTKSLFFIDIAILMMTMSFLVPGDIFPTISGIALSLIYCVIFNHVCMKAITGAKSGCLFSIFYLVAVFISTSVLLFLGQAIRKRYFIETWQWIGIWIEILIVLVALYCVAVAWGKRSGWKPCKEQLQEYNHYISVLQKYNCDITTRKENLISRMDACITYPEAHVVDLDFERADLLKHYLDTYLKTEEHKELLEKRKDSEKLERYLYDPSPTLYMNNDVKEQYLLLIRDIFGTMGKFPAFYNYMQQFMGRLQLRDKNSRSICIDIPQTGKQIGINRHVFSRITDSYNKCQQYWSEFNSVCKRTFIGQEGERIVSKELEFFSNNMRILRGIRFEVNGESVETDIIVVAPQGVFAIEVKNLGSTGSYNVVIEKDGLWKKVARNGRVLEVMGSVSKQNARHIHGIEQVVNTKLNNTLERWLKAHSIIVFANDVVGVENNSDNIVIRASELAQVIRNYPQSLNEEQIQEIADILQAESLPPKKYEVQNWYSLLVGEYLEILELINIIKPEIDPYMDVIDEYLKYFPDYEIRLNPEEENQDDIIVYKRD